MATHDNSGRRFENYRSGTAGNAQIRPIAFAPGAVAAGDAYRLMKIYPGMRIDSVRATIHDDADTGDTLDVGWVAGETDASAATVPAADGDVDYFIDGGSIAAEGSIESRANTHHKPLVVEQDGYIVAVLPGAVVSADALDITFHVEFEYLGNL